MLSAGVYYAIYYTLQDNNCIPLIRFDSCSIVDDYTVNSSPVTEGEFGSQFAAWEANYPMSNDAFYHNGYEINETNIQKMLENIQNVMANDKHFD